MPEFAGSRVDNFRQLGVGLVDIGNPIPDGLVTVQVGIEILVIAGITHTPATLQVRCLIDFQGAVEVTEVVLVRDHRVVPVTGPTPAKPGPGGEIQCPAIATLAWIVSLEGGIVVDITQLQDRFTKSTQVTPFYFGKQPTTMNVLGCQGGIVMRRQVQVIR